MASPNAAAASDRDGTSLHGIRLQLVTLGSLRCAEAVAWTSVFPYVYFMIRSFDGVGDEKESRITFYAGMLIGVFTFCEFLSGMVWARLSDRFGRRSVLLIGAFGGMISALTFGTSKSIIVATASRAFGGLSNPNNGVVQTTAVEIAGDKARQGEIVSQGQDGP